MAFDEKWEKNIYSRRRQLNEYPYDLVVSIFAKNFYRFKPAKRRKIKILDLGSGAGNHSKFFAEQGFSAYGLDGALSAVEHCRKKFKKLGLKADFRQGDFTALPYPDDYFDACLDRESLYANNSEDIRLVLNQVYKKLKTGGLFVSFVFNEFHPDIKMGEKIGSETYEDFKPGSSFYNSGIAHFFTKKEIIKLFFKFKIENIMRHSLYEVYDKKNKTAQFDEYIIIARKN
ncbi:MAG: class I SAM-dependent methyltransferase [bacterium]|nr:class I SAM-dependent methyltransferase [bacterium]